MSKKPLVFVCFIVLILVLFFIYSEEIQSYISVDNLKILKIQWQDYYSNNFIKVSFYYFLINTILAILPSPGISMVSCLGGVLLGFLPAFILSSLASSLGNLFAFCIARYSLRDWILENFYIKHKYYFDRLDENAAELLFSMRLIPLIPSFVTTLIISISDIRSFSFYWISCLGRAPMVALYAWTGHEISKINKIEDIFDIRIILSLFLLSVFPWFMKLVKKHFSMK